MTVNHWVRGSSPRWGATLKGQFRDELALLLYAAFSFRLICLRQFSMSVETSIVIYIDADACPVKNEVFKVAARHGLKVYLVSNQWLRMEVGANVEKIVVADGADAADDWIAENINESGICITADIPLAKRCLDAGAVALGPTGRQFSEGNIAMAMGMRELNQHLRETGESKGYNASFTKQDRSNFLQALEAAIQALLRR